LNREDQQVPEQGTEPLIGGEGTFRVEVAEEENEESNDEGGKYTGKHVYR
jgi:hypothetical protein